MIFENLHVWSPFVKFKNLCYNKPMLISEIQGPLTNIAGVGAAAVSQLKRLGVENAGDLLRLFPRDWEDRSKINVLLDWNKFQKNSRRSYSCRP